jgi:hypothetical protein
LEKARAKAFLRQSQDEDSRKPIAIRANQAIQRARSRAKAFYAKGNGRSLKFPTSQKADTPTPRQAETNRQAKQINLDRQVTKKIR